MSIWTHVNAAIRIDGIPGMFTNRPDLGTSWDSDEIEAAAERDQTFDPDGTIPAGSEGSLRYSVIEYGTGLPWLAVNVWGDLRDFGLSPDDIESVVAYLERITGPGILVRDGVATIQVEDRPAQVWLWRGFPPEKLGGDKMGEWIRVDGAKP